MSISDMDLDEFLKIAKKEGITYESREEAEKSARDLLQFAEIMYDIYQEDKARKDRLEKEPEGYTMDGNGRSCALCGQSIVGDMWYDKWGMKCMDCHDAYKKKVIPGYVFTDRDNKKHVTASTLSWKMDIPTVTIRKLIRHNRIKARHIKANDTYVILRKENPELKHIIEDEKKALISRKKK